jgi:hypothetical protein
VSISILVPERGRKKNDCNPKAAARARPVALRNPKRGRPRIKDSTKPWEADGMSRRTFRAFR